MRRLIVRQAVGTRLVEAVTGGLAFGSLLWWAGSCLVGVFTPQNMAMPYWSGLPGLRTDTSGVVAFLLATVCLAVSEYMRLSRRQGQWCQADDAWHFQNEESPVAIRHPTALMIQATCSAIAVMATGLVIYISLNSVTHPVTLNMQATHLMTWPTEGSLRVVSVVCCVVSVTILRFLRSSRASNVTQYSSRGS